MLASMVRHRAANLRKSMAAGPLTHTRWLAQVQVPPVDLAIFQTQLVRDVKRLEEQKLTRDKWIIDEDATVFEATKKMAELKVGSLCVERKGRVVGIITERDYLRKVLHAGRRSESTQVKDIATMEDKLIVACPTDTLQDCVAVMASKKFRHLPVADDGGEVVGLISIRDVAKALADQRLERIYTVEDQKTATSMPIHDG